MKIGNFVFFHYQEFLFGELLAKKFTLFEHKKLFGLIFFYFKGGKQDRYHTHAFNALSIKLFGSYDEYVYEPYYYGNTGRILIEPRKTVFKWFPKDRYHSINNSNGCLTFLIQGPWKGGWYEYYINTRETKFLTSRSSD